MNTNTKTEKPSRKKYYARMLGIGFILALLAFLAFILLGCATPPTKFEQALFDIKTNTITTTFWVTNTVQVTNAVVVFQTNEDKTVITIPKLVVETRTNTVLATNLIEVTEWTTKTNVTGAVGKVGEIGNIFAPGLGTLAAAIASGLLGIWGTARRKNAQIDAVTQTAATLTQIIQVGRELITRTNPQLADKWKVWMEEHQRDQAVLEKVIEVMKLGVNRPDASYTADQLLKLMQDVKTPTPPV